MSEERAQNHPSSTVSTETSATRNSETASNEARNPSTRKVTKTLAPKKARRAKKAKKEAGPSPSRAKYPRHSLSNALRIPRGLLEQNAGKEASVQEAARFVGVGFSGDFGVELSSATKYGLLDRPSPKTVKVTDLARKILRPQNPEEEIEGLRQAVMNAPDVSDVYKHYRGENLPDDQFFDNALVDTFHLPQEKLSEFKRVLLDTLATAHLTAEHEGKIRILDVSQGTGPLADTAKIQQPARGVPISPGQSCFVMMPFALPVGGYYASIYEPAIRKAGLTPIRADAEIFGTGKIIDQVWRGLNGARVLVAELTGRNPNVFYELGLAHALKKPVVLVSSNEADVPFDLQHIRVIYYDMKDPFWGQKLIDKISENIISALKNPEQATFAEVVEARA